MAMTGATTPTLNAAIREQVPARKIEVLRETVNGPSGAESSTDAGASNRSMPEWARNALDWAASRTRYRDMIRLVRNGGDVKATLGNLPDRMHLLANQTSLILELVNDYRSGTYRDIPWKSLSVGAAGLLYVLSPIDVIPDFLSGIGIVDDMLVLSVVSRAIRSDLEKYCAFKGYAPSDYFGQHAAAA